MISFVVKVKESHQCVAFERNCLTLPAITRRRYEDVIYDLYRKGRSYLVVVQRAIHKYHRAQATVLNGTLCRPATVTVGSSTR